MLDNEARYNDYVPLIYGTAWYAPPIVFARNDGNLTHLEVLLGAGVIDSISTVLVNDIAIPQAQTGVNMTATGWYNVVTYGTRNGAFNLDFTDASGAPLGDPYGSMAMLSVVTPNQISNGQTLPSIQSADQRTATWNSSTRAALRWANRSPIIPRGCCWMCCAAAVGSRRRSTWSASTMSRNTARD